MKAEIVYNTKDEPRILLTLESMQDGIRMADQPNLELVTIETSVHGPTKMAYAIVPSHAFQLHEDGEIQPLSAAEMANPAYAMRGGKSEADYQKFIGRYKATVGEALDECLKRDDIIADLRRQLKADEPPRCPTCEAFLVNQGTEVTDEDWYCDDCQARPAF